MHRDPDDPFCPSCASYVHPFLDACPVCGLERTSCFAAATAVPDQGFVALASDSRVARDVEQVVMRYTLKAAGATVTTDLHVGLTAVAGSVDYRVRVGGDAGEGSERGFVEVTEEDVIVRDRTASRERARVSLAAILAVSAAARGRRGDAWTGLVFEGRREGSPPPPLDGELVVAHATPTGLGRFSLSNRTGMLSPKARPDHYAILARWLGLAAAAAAERSWSAVGSPRHAHELGLAPPPPAAAAAGPLETAADPAVARGSSVADALRLLEQLRTDGLVTDDEYHAKRREVLARI